MIALNSIIPLLLIVAIYLLAGLFFAIPFAIRGVTRIDEGAKGSKWGFRIIIIPGAIVFWPVLLRKWIKVKTTESHKH